MKVYIVIGLFFGLFLSVSCHKEVVRFDRSACSTLIDIKIESLTFSNDSVFTLETSMYGGVGQSIEFLGHCWSVNAGFPPNLKPTISSNNIKVSYESIIFSSFDLNGDGIIDNRDIPADGSLMRRHFSSKINIKKGQNFSIVFRPFVIFNDTITRYGQHEEYILNP
jgi:hypothetical protein